MADLFDAEIPAHDEVLADDQLTVLVINYRWRRILAPLLDDLMRDSFWVGTEAEIADAIYKADNLIFDLYDEYPMQKLAARFKAGPTVFLIDSETITYVDFADPTADSENYDFGDFWDVSDPSVVTIPTGMAGIYNVSATVLYLAPGSATERMSQISKNSSVVVAVNRETTDVRFQVSLSGDVSMEVGDTLRLFVYSEVDDAVVVQFSFHRVFR